MNTQIEAQVFATLAAHAPLTAVVGTRMAVNAVPEGSGYPCVVYAARVERVATLAGTADENEAQVSFQCWAESPAAARTLADLVRAAVEDTVGTYDAIVTSEMTIFDDDLGLDGVQLEVQWWPG